METKQPEWELIANLGDCNPVDYGGYFVYRDTTGTYAPEGEILVAPEEGNGGWLVYRYTLNRCTWRPSTGTLSDNEFHPEMCTWFASRESARGTRPQDTTYLSNVARFVGIALPDLRALFCSENPLDRAHAYRTIGDYHGFENLDSYPLQFSDREEVEARYKNAVRKGQS